MKDFKTEDYIRYRFKRAKETLTEIQMHYPILKILLNYWNGNYFPIRKADRVICKMGFARLSFGRNNSIHEGCNIPFVFYFFQCGRIDNQFIRNPVLNTDLRGRFSL